VEPAEVLLHDLQEIMRISRLQRGALKESEFIFFKVLAKERGSLLRRLISGARLIGELSESQLAKARDLVCGIIAIDAENEKLVEKGLDEIRLILSDLKRAGGYSTRRRSPDRGLINIWT
jgi:hypothetical protein